MNHATHGSGGRTRHVKGIVLGALLIPVNLQWQMQTETVTGVFVFSVFVFFLRDTPKKNIEDFARENRFLERNIGT